MEQKEVLIPFPVPDYSYNDVILQILQHLFLIFSLDFTYFAHKWKWKLWLT